MVWQRNIRYLLLPITQCLCLCVVGISIHGQTIEQHGDTSVLKTSTQLVVVDVVVQDNHGNPVHGLKADNFRITENKDQQDVRQFEEHISAPSNPVQGKLDLPPGTFTNYTPVKADAPLNILLLDTINTSHQYIPFLQKKLQDFVSHADPNSRVAIITMAAHRLTMVQGFTTDPRLVKYVVESKLNLEASPFLDNNKLKNEFDERLEGMPPGKCEKERGKPPPIPKPGDKEEESCMALQAFAEAVTEQTTLRMKTSLDTFDELARYLIALPGRKNLIWVSGSFPLSTSPNDKLLNPYTMVSSVDKEYRKTANLFARAQVAVYPVDARGLLNPMLDGINKPQRPDQKPISDSTIAQDFFESQVDEHATMEKMADDTGGRASYNNNDVSSAVKAAIDAGANYYTLAYSPTNHHWDSRFRSIHVEMTGPLAGSHLKLSYRLGYYADDPSATPSKIMTGVAKADQQTDKPSSPMRMALNYGAPAPTDIIFKVKVAPAAAALEEAVAANNRPGSPTKGPYRRYSVDYAVVARTLTWKTSADGQMECSAELGALVYDRDGILLNSVSQPFQYKGSAAEYKLLTQQGMQLHLEVSAPAKGDSYLRLAIHDLFDDKFGAVELPTSIVDKLPTAP